MKIVICGSMAFARQMFQNKKILQKMGHQVILPEGAEKYCQGRLKKLASGWGTLEGARMKIKYNLIKKHYEQIKKADAILVLNKDKNGIKNYIGGNSFLEMGFAHVLGKRIYVFNILPKDLPIFYQELIAMQPALLKGNLRLVK